MVARRQDAKVSHCTVGEKDSDRRTDITVRV
jgi:hypothetical protein